ncbi:class I SAM-dependent methyltransferase [Cohnella hashimotonis]|uniref:Class I SAM-dependent methyltransferase n=1 Tax=Cohnella hashimotonis TaxID=2826895 RepID=A0ABT6TUR5_9BACL|nr:class I SAM-dependent methyltransferase [Cohnella hashimotonis]MDI4650296.1 class I SAM-dependent methyltransferase [Cohnella hashimotonis]
MINFCCIDCSSLLHVDQEHLICSTCGKRYPIEGGLYLFPGSDFYYSDSSPEEMRELIINCKKQGWLAAALQSFKEKPFVVDIIADETRADWQYLIDLPFNSTILDIGAGWGTLSVALARNFKHVVALEGTKDRLEFARIRAEQEGISNLTTVHADFFKHPFQNGQFDLVSFNGVLEWVGMGSKSENPRNRQVEALKLAYELLKEGGYLYIGIENAYGLKYLLGDPDDHTGVKYITYLERQEANLLNQKQNGMDYRTFTYNMDGYINLLHEASFSNVEFFCPYPDYKRIESLHNLSNTNVTKFQLDIMRASSPRDERKERAIDIGYLLNGFDTMKQFTNSYSILARKRENYATSN